MRAAALRTYRQLLQAAWVREVPVGPVDETLARVGRVLREAEIPFAIAAGFAVIEHGYERFTKDVDLLVGTAFDGDERALASSSRARRLLPVIPLEHLVLMKLETGRSKDDADVVELLKAGTSAATVERYLRGTWPELLPRFRQLAARARSERTARRRRRPSRRKTP